MAERLEELALVIAITVLALILSGIGMCLRLLAFILVAALVLTQV